MPNPPGRPLLEWRHGRAIGLEHGSVGTAPPAGAGWQQCSWRGPLWWKAYIKGFSVASVLLNLEGLPVETWDLHISCTPFKKTAFKNKAQKIHVAVKYELFSIVIYIVRMIKMNARSKPCYVVLPRTCVCA